MNQERRPIESRSDIEELVQKFYARVRADALIGPIFNDVAHVNWDEHLPKIANFWCDLLLGENTYQGRPFPPHIKLNLKVEHFERWIQLFFLTVDENFVGLKADEVKRRALNMGRNFLINLRHMGQEP